MISFSKIKKAFIKSNYESTRKWQIQPYMKTPDVVAMDLKSFVNSEQVKIQCALARDLAFNIGGKK